MMLRVQAGPELIFAIGVERHQIKIVAGAAMYYLTGAINGCVDHRARNPAVLRLNVIELVSDGDVRIVAKEHRCLVSLANTSALRISPHLTEWRLNAIITLRL